LSQGPFEFSSSSVFELAHLNRAIAKLARPALYDEEPAPQRKEMIELLWDRKRELLRLVDPSGGWTPNQPVA
jgi:hypothetical protein